jgi:hypothetical protein
MADEFHHYSEADGASGRTHATISDAKARFTELVNSHQFGDARADR